MPEEPQNPLPTLDGRDVPPQRDDRSSSGSASLHAPALKEIMLGLIYPAVLGTIMYTALDASLGRILQLFVSTRPETPSGVYIVRQTQLCTF